MDKTLYYSDTSTISANSNKTRFLSEFIRLYKSTIFEFDTDFTEDIFLRHLRNIVAGLNQNYRGADISVYKIAVEGRIYYNFKKPDGTNVAQILLRRVSKCFNSEEDL